MQKSAEGIVGPAQARLVRHPKAERRGNGEASRTRVGRRPERMEGLSVLDRGNAPAQQLELPFAERRGEAAVGASGGDTPVGDEGLMERVVERENLLAALRRVKRNGGSPGIDGMTVEDLGYLREQWPRSERRCWPGRTDRSR